MRKSPTSLDAWAAYQRGLWHLSNVNAEDNALAQKFFEQAVDGAVCAGAEQSIDNDGRRCDNSAQ